MNNCRHCHQTLDEHEGVYFNCPKNSGLRFTPKTEPARSVTPSKLTVSEPKRA